MDKIIPWTTRLKQVDAEAWAAFLADRRTYQTEEVWPCGPGQYSVMYSKRSNHCVIAEVHYLPNGGKAYFIDPAAPPDAELATQQETTPCVKSA